MEFVTAIVHSVSAVITTFLGLPQFYRSAYLLPLGSGLAAGAVLWLGVMRRNSTLSVVAQGPVQTSLSLQVFADGRLPLSSQQENIQRWYMLRNRIELSHVEGQGIIVGHQFVLYVMFEADVRDRQFVLSSPNSKIPPHEIKDISSRHAIVLFNGAFDDGLVELQFVS